MADDLSKANPEEENYRRPVESGDKRKGKVVLKTTEYVTLALTGLVVLYVLSIPLGFIGKENRYDIPEIVLVITIVIVFSGALGRLTEITVEPGKLSARLNNVEEKTDKLGEEQSKLKEQIEALRIALRGVVNVFELDKLKGLSGEGPFTVRYHPRMYEELRELVTSPDYREVNRGRAAAGSTVLSGVGTRRLAKAHSGAGVLPGRQRRYQHRLHHGSQMNSPGCSSQRSSALPARPAPYEDGSTHRRPRRGRN